MHPSLHSQLALDQLRDAFARSQVQFTAVSHDKLFKDLIVVVRAPSCAPGAIGLLAVLAKKSNGLNQQATAAIVEKLAAAASDVRAVIAACDALARLAKDHECRVRTP